MTVTGFPALGASCTTVQVTDPKVVETLMPAVLACGKLRLLAYPCRLAVGSYVKPLPTATPLPPLAHVGPELGVTVCEFVSRYQSRVESVPLSGSESSITAYSEPDPLAKATFWKISPHALPIGTPIP